MKSLFFSDNFLSEKRDDFEGCLKGVDGCFKGVAGCLKGVWSSKSCMVPVKQILSAAHMGDIDFEPFQTFHIFFCKISHCFDRYTSDCIRLQILYRNCIEA